jgi:hypothetical protein
MTAYIAVVPKEQAQAVLTLAQQMDYKEHSIGNDNIARIHRYSVLADTT